MRSQTWLQLVLKERISALLRVVSQTELQKAKWKATVVAAKMKINLPDGNWDVEVFLGAPEPGHDDYVFLRIAEECPESTRMLRANQITVGITAIQARELARLLLEVAGDDDMPEHPSSNARTKSGQKHLVERRKLFTEKQGRYLAFIHRYQQKYLQSPASGHNEIISVSASR